jgi:hypothetical protein
MRFTRRHVQLVLGVLWILDGALQLQSFMFSTGFARDILAPAAEGQPGWVAAPMRFFADHIAQYPALLDTAFAVIQLALGVGLLLPRTARAAILASLGWALGVWWFGEGFGGLASGHATLVTGAPGAVVLYAILAAAAWPGRTTDRGQDASRRPVADWLPAAWAVIWVGGAVLQLLPGQNHAGDLAAQISGGADGAPGWLAATERVTGSILGHLGTGAVVVLVLLMAAIGLAAVIPGRVRTAAATAGTVLALAFWVVGQNLGELYSGQSTDPNSGPLLLLFAAALASCTAATARRSAAPARPRSTVTKPTRPQHAGIRYPLVPRTSHASTRGESP